MLWIGRNSLHLCLCSEGQFPGLNEDGEVGTEGKLLGEPDLRATGAQISGFSGHRFGHEFRRPGFRGTQEATFDRQAYMD